jgi:hypothetical protein
MEELFLPHAREQVHEVRSLAAGYVLDVVRARPARIGIGLRGAVNFIPDSLATYYGGPRPVGAAVFARIGFGRSRPARAPSRDMKQMEHMDHSEHPATSEHGGH